MSQVWISQPLKISLPIEPCAVCVALYKQAVLNANPEAIARANGDGDHGGKTWITDQDVTGQPVQDAVIETVSLEYAVLGKVWLCMTHAPAIETNPQRVAELQSQARRAALQQAAAQGAAMVPIPPGLLDGRSR